MLACGITARFFVASRSLHGGLPHFRLGTAINRSSFGYEGSVKFHFVADGRATEQTYIRRRGAEAQPRSPDDTTVKTPIEHGVNFAPVFPMLTINHDGKIDRAARGSGLMKITEFGMRCGLSYAGIVYWILRGKVKLVPTSY